MSKEAPARGRMQVSRIRDAALVGALGVAVALPLSEIAVRALHLAPDVRLIDVTADDTVYQRSTNPILGFELKKNWRDPQADLVRSYPSTNSHGQRDVERTLAKPPNVRRVLLLGASVVEGVGIRDLDDTMSRQLEQTLGDGTQVLNFGVSAYCTRAKVELLRTKGLAFSPDVVVLVFARSDFDNFNRQAFQLAAPASRPPATRLFGYSHAFRALATRLDWFGYRAQVDPAGWNAEAIGDNNVVDGLALFADLARGHGFTPIVGVWPRFTDEAFDDSPEVPGRPGELVVEALCRMDGLPSFRFSTQFAADLAAQGAKESPRKRYTIGDRIHPNPLGCRVAAGALRDEIARLAAAFRPGVSGPRDDAAIAAARTLGANAVADTRHLVNLGNSLLRDGKTAEAIDAYRRALAADPRLAEAHHNLGVALRGEGHAEEALLEFAQAARLDPELADAHLRFGVTLLEMGRPRDAIPALERAVALRPDSEPAREALEAARRALAGPSASDTAATSVTNGTGPAPSDPLRRTTP